MSETFVPLSRFIRERNAQSELERYVREESLPRISKAMEGGKQESLPRTLVRYATAYAKPALVAGVAGIALDYASRKTIGVEGAELGIAVMSAGYVLKATLGTAMTPYLTSIFRKASKNEHFPQGLAQKFDKSFEELETPLLWGFGRAFRAVGSGGLYALIGMAVNHFYKTDIDLGFCAGIGVALSVRESINAYRDIQSVKDKILLYINQRPMVRNVELPGIGK